MSRKGIPNKKPFKERFWSRVRKTSGCWLWTGATNNHGYGIFHSPIGRLAHRYSWFLHTGQAPVNVILHSCDTPLCVRPQHLRLGSQSENMRDALMRNRGHGRSKLTPDKVNAIRAAIAAGNISLRNIGKDFGITKAAVAHIKYGITWSWLQ
jgi:hypothetical protein